MKLRNTINNLVLDSLSPKDIGRLAMFASQPRWRMRMRSEWQSGDCEDWMQRVRNVLGPSGIEFVTATSLFLLQEQALQNNRSS